MTKKYTNNLLFEAKVSFTVYLTKLEHQKHFGNVFLCVISVINQAWEK